MPIIKKFVKSFLFFSYSLFALLNQKINIFKTSKNKGIVFPLILHDIPINQINYFKGLLVKLKKEHKFLNPEDFVSFIKGDSNIDKNYNMLTFDDGFYSNYIIAKEVLAPLGIKAIFFVSTEFIDSHNTDMQQNFIKQNICLGEFPSSMNIDEMKPMSWENLSELINMGHTIGSHTKNHLRLSKINEDSLLKEEIIASGNRIEEMLRIKVEHFAFPFGDIGSIDKKALDLIRKRYKYIYSGVRGQNSPGTNPFAIRREALDIENSYEYNSFIAGGGLSLYYWKARRRLDAMVS